jgi:hypothetical protein
VDGQRTARLEFTAVARYAKSFPRVWFARRVDIARWWLENYNDLPALPLSATAPAEETEHP